MILSLDLLKRLSVLIDNLMVNHHLIKEFVADLNQDQDKVKQQVESIVNDNLKLLYQWRNEEQKIQNLISNYKTNCLQATNNSHNNHHDLQQDNYNVSQFEDSQFESEGLFDSDSSDGLDDADVLGDVNEASGSRNGVSGDRKNDKRKNKRLFCCQWPGCGYETYINANMKKHSRVHTGEKPFVCDWPDCGKRYQQRSGFVAHQRAHQGVKPFVCNWPGCEYKTNNQSSMPAHKRTHTGVKLFKCDWQGCQVSCPTKTHLTTHRMIHTGEKPFECNDCGQKFNKISNLKAHQLSVHQGIKRKRKKN